MCGINPMVLNYIMSTPLQRRGMSFAFRANRLIRQLNECNDAAAPIDSLAQSYVFNLLYNDWNENFDRLVSLVNKWTDTADNDDDGMERNMTWIHDNVNPPCW